MKIQKLKHITARVESSDANFIKRKVKNFGERDPRFKDDSAAIRHYIHLGIITEKRTEAANTLTNRIIKETQRDVVQSELSPIKNSVDDLITAVEQLNENQNKMRDDVLRQMNIQLQKLEAIFTTLQERTEQLLNIYLTSGNISEEILKNVIILRSIQYLFLLGIKTGRIPADERLEWQEVVSFAHNLAHSHSIEELKMINSKTLEHNAVENMARELFEKVRFLSSKMKNK